MHHDNNHNQPDIENDAAPASSSSSSSNSTTSSSTATCQSKVLDGFFVIAFVVLNVAVNLFNKWTFTTMGLQVPLLATVLHQLVVFILFLLVAICCSCYCASKRPHASRQYYHDYYDYRRSKHHWRQQHNQSRNLFVLSGWVLYLACHSKWLSQTGDTRKQNI